MTNIPEFNALRALVAARVALFHLYPNVFFFPIPGVDTFFIISGFLVTRILEAKQDSTNFYKVFHLRRVLRIAPIYYIALAFVLFVMPLATESPRPNDSWPYFLTFTAWVPKLWGGEMGHFNGRFGHTWTLMIEVQFFLIWPFVVRNLTRKNLLITCGVLLCTSISLRAAGFSPDLLLTRCDGLVMGAALAIVLSEWDEVRIKTLLKVLYILSGVSIAFLAWGSIKYGPEFTWPAHAPYPGAIFFCINLISTTIVAAVIVHSGARQLGLFRTKTLSALGTVSYGFYLYHLLVYWLIDGIEANLQLQAKIGPFADEALKLGLTLVVAGISWKWIEKPILSLKTKLPYEKPAPAPTRSDSSPSPGQVKS